MIASGSFDASLSSSGQGGIVNIVAKHSPHKLRRGLLMSLRSKCADVRLVVAAVNYDRLSVLSLEGGNT